MASESKASDDLGIGPIASQPPLCDPRGDGQCDRFTPKFRDIPCENGMEALHVYILPTPGVDHDLLSRVQACRRPALVDYPIDLAHTPKTHTLSTSRQR